MLRHWVSKHSQVSPQQEVKLHTQMKIIKSEGEGKDRLILLMMSLDQPDVFYLQDFEMNSELKTGVVVLLEEVLRDPDLLPQERKATSNILRFL